MSYSINDTRTKALIYNTLEQKVDGRINPALIEHFSDSYIKIISFDKTEEPYYNATVDILLRDDESDATKVSIKISNDYFEFFDCKSDCTIVLNKKEDNNIDIYSVKFINIGDNLNRVMTLNTQVRKGIMKLETPDIYGSTEENDVLTIAPNYARALPDNYLTSVSGLKVSIDGDNLIIS